MGKIIAVNISEEKGTPKKKYTFRKPYRRLGRGARRSCRKMASPG